MPLDSLFKSLTKDSWQKDWWLLFAFKIALAVFLPFFSDEAYYWVWSHNLKLSYFDHPPLISWLFLLGKPLESFYFAARIPTVIVGHLTIWIWCQHLAQNFTTSQKRLLLWILSTHMLVGFGSLIANPDIPFLFFWSLSILFYLKSLQEIRSLIWPTLLGVSLGLGFTSKYLLGLFAPLAILHLVISGKWRDLKWQHYALPFSFGALFSSPVWIWNAMNDWESFKFQLDHGLGKKWKPQWTGDFLAGTLVLLFPAFVFTFFKEKLFKKIKDFHVCVFIFLFLFFTYTTFGGDTELNWPLTLYPSFFLVVVPFLRNKWSKALYFSFFGGLGLTLILFMLFPPSFKTHGRLQEASLYQRLFKETQKYNPLYTSTYQTASYFWFLKKEPVYKLRYASRRDEYDFMQGSLPSTNEFFYLKEVYQRIPNEQLDMYDFEKVVDLENKFEVYLARKKQ